MFGPSIIPNLPFLEWIKERPRRLYIWEMPPEFVRDCFQYDSQGLIIMDAKLNIFISSKGLQILENYKKLIAVDYLHRLREFFLQNKGKKYTISRLTDNPEKFIDHIKYYIDSRHFIEMYCGDYVDVSFNNEYTKIIIHE